MIKNKAGPRYTYNISRFTDSAFRKHATQVFGEFLCGGVHGVDNVFAAVGRVTNSANASSMQMGGGADLTIEHAFGVRLLE